ncbi:MAG: CoA-binding protein, partial [Chitinophagales bacterium]
VRMLRGEAVSKMFGPGYDNEKPVDDLDRRALAGEEILIGQPEIEDVHTVTIYLNPKNQVEYYEYILDNLQPQRIVFNPGSENSELIEMAEDHEIEVIEGCTLVMLSAGQY